MDLNFPEYLDIQPLLGISEENNGSFSYEAQADSIRQVGLAGRVWEAAYALRTYLNPPAYLSFSPPFSIDDGPTGSHALVIELGAGTGIVSLTASHILPQIRPNAKLIATDLPEVCPILERNLASAPISESTIVHPLEWGNQIHLSSLLSSIVAWDQHLKLTTILCSDLIYFPELFAPLLRSLLALTSPPFCDHPFQGECYCTPTVIIAYKIRSLPKESAFWSTFGLWFSYSPIVVSNSSMTTATSTRNDGVLHQHSTADLPWDPTDTFLFSACRKPETLGWDIPSDDASLMAGVLPSSQYKADDTFESFLFLSMACLEDD